MNKVWPHQARAMQLTGEAISNGKKAVCIVMSTGAGKTYTGGLMASRHLLKKEDGQILWTAHREELVSQAYDELTAQGNSCGVIQANPTRPCNPHRPVQICSTQTLLARNLFPPASMVFLDEVHHYASDKWGALAAEYKKRGVYIIGLTATPVRADGRGLEDIFDALVIPVTMKGLISGGFLVPFEMVRPGAALKNDQIAQSPVDAWLAHAKGRKTIVFAGHIAAATAFRDQFREAGIKAELVTGAMDAGERRQILAAYKAGEIAVLCNVGVLTEGFDDKPTSCVILARSVGSLSLYLQMCGRALRVSEETGKTDAVLIDLHGSSHTHLSPDEDREWVLEGDGIKHKTKIVPIARFCPICGCPVEGDATACELCGIAKPELVPPDVVNVKLERYQAKRREPEEVRKAYFKRLQAEAFSKNYNPFQAVKKYEALYGERPPRAWGWR